MKIRCLILTLFLIQIAKGQINNIDSLVARINNNQLYGTCHYVWILEMKSSAGEELIKFGYPAINKLILYLDDNEKGIITHYIITKIHGIYNLSSSFDHIEKDSIIDYNLNGLRFFEKLNHFYTYDSLLIKNKKQWIDKLKNEFFFNYRDSIQMRKLH